MEDPYEPPPFPWIFHGVHLSSKVHDESWSEFLPQGSLVEEQGLEPC